MNIFEVVIVTGDEDDMEKHLEVWKLTCACSQ